MKIGLDFISCVIIKTHSCGGVLMVFNDTSNKNGLIQHCEQNLFGDSPFGHISGNADRLKIFTNLLNEGLSQYTYKAQMSDGNWEMDDRNYTDISIGTRSLVLGQRDYAISTEHDIIVNVEVKDTAGNWYSLKELDERFFSENNKSISNYQASGNGTPAEYTKFGNSIFLFPAPNYSQNASLKVHFKRAPDYYVYTDTTKTQGFTEQHATYLSDYATWKYALMRTMPIAGNFARNIEIWHEVRIPEFYNKRSAEHSKKLRPAYKTSR